MKDIINNKFSEAKTKKDEEDFKNYYQNMSELNDYRNKYSKEYEDHIAFKLKEFKTLHSDNVKQMMDIINNKFSEAKAKKDEKDFINYYQEMSELNDYRDKYSKEYEDHIAFKLNEFKKFKIINLLNDKFKEAKLKKNEEEFEIYYKELEEIKNFINDYPELFNNYISSKLIEFRKYQKIEKDNMKSFIDDKFKKAKLKNNENEFKEYYEFKELEEYRNNYSEALKNYIDKNFPEIKALEDSEENINNNVLDDKKKAEEDFKLYYEELKKFENYKKK